MSTKPRILIVGASIAGLTVANGLKQTSVCEVIVFERCSESETGRLPKNGGGIGLHEKSAKLLNSLGISTDFALPMNIQEDKDRTGRIIRRRKIPFYSAFWGDVHKCLLEKALAVGVIVLYNKNVTSIYESDSGVSIWFFDGTDRFEGDCVIGADGILSTLRSLLFSDKSNETESDLVRHVGYYAWRGLVPLEDLPPDSAERLCQKGIFTIELSEKSHAIFYYLPRGLNWLIYFNSDPEATSTYHRSNDIVGQITKNVTDTDLQELYRSVKLLYRPAIVELIKASKHPLPFTNEMYDRKLLSTFSTKRCILIGDAAHPTTPHHLRGSNMAIADGFVLANELAVAFGENDSKWSTALKDAFTRFENQRLTVCNDVVKLSARIGRVRQGVYCDQQLPSWDTLCQNNELSELLCDVNSFANDDF